MGKKKARSTDSEGLLLGWTRPATVRRPRIGFTAPEPLPGMASQPLFFNSEGHLLTIAPTGAGKGVSCIIPALLTYSGPVICIDPKGEAYHVTAKRRRKMGQRVIRLDPFGVIDRQADALNPLDLLDLQEPEDEARAMAEMLAGGPTSLREAFWDNTAQAFMSGLLLYLAASVPKEERCLSTLRDFFGQQDVPYAIAKLLDEKRVKHRDARQEFSIFLQHPAKETRPKYKDKNIFM